MPKSTKWLIGVAAGVLVLTLALGAVLVGWFVVRPAVAGPTSIWPGPGMMGRLGGQDTQVEWNAQRVPGGSCSSGGVACPHGGIGGAGTNPASACPFGGANGCGESVPRSGETLTLEEARQSVERYVASSGNNDLVVDEVMAFDLNFYAIVKEESTGIGAFEVLVDKWAGTVRLEPGPNMMWNARYGMMGGRGMMGRGYAGGAGIMQYSPDQARATAQEWLDQNLPGVETRADEVDAFYGYYTLHLWKDGQLYGMLSVDGASGQVWYHSWHGTFIAAQEDNGD